MFGLVIGLYNCLFDFGRHSENVSSNFPADWISRTKDILYSLVPTYSLLSRIERVLMVIILRSREELFHELFTNGRQLFLNEIVLAFQYLKMRWGTYPQKGMVCINFLGSRSIW